MRPLPRVLDSLQQDVRYAARGMRSRPGFTAAVVFTIALGVGADATMFGVLDRLLLRAPDHVRDPDRVVLVETRTAGSPYTDSSFPYAAYVDYRDHPGGFASVAATYSANFPLDRGPAASRVRGALVSSSFFTTLGVQPLRGRFFSTDEDDANHPQSVAVVSDGFWRRYFGGRDDALGRRVSIGAHDYTVIGVAPKGFTGVELSDVDIWLPITANSGLRFDNSPDWTTSRRSSWLRLVARVKDGVSLDVAASEATVVHRDARRQQIAQEIGRNPRVTEYVKPDSESVILAPIVPGKVPTGFSGTVSAQDVRVSKLLGIVSLIVLIIACANVSNLLLVRAFNRRREMAVRLALGVSRARLMEQLVVEGLLLSLMGGAGALLVAHWTSHGVRTLLLGPDAWTAEAIDQRMLLFTAVATLVAGLLASLAPAIQAGHTDLAGALRMAGREGGSGHRSPLRTALLVVQAALAILLLTGAGLFVRSVDNVNALPFGIDLDHVLVGDVSHSSVGLSTAEARRLYEEFVRRAHGVPGVRSAAVSVGLPFMLSWGTQVFVPGRQLPKLQHSPNQYAVTSEYFPTMGVRLVAGRLLAETDRAGTVPVAVINQMMVRVYWPQQNPIGQCMKLGADTMPCTTIVGVVTNTVRQQFDDILPQVYRPLDQLSNDVIDRTVSHFGFELVVRTSGEAAGSAEAIRRMMQSVSAVVPYANVRPMRDLLDRRMRAWHLGAKVFTAFGALALVLAAVGLYAVLAFSISQRLHEFGVRRALGAQSTDLVRLTLSAGLAPVLAGIAAGTLLALGLGRFVAGLLFGISPRDPLVLSGVCVVVIVTGALASLLPAWRAARVDPAAVLRSD
ncbi:MAG TPA: ABC transporter permease [Gemmatimonadaceae bacterium]|nr:ABC transporter permease [Gemmatimonadaceae bacterium]